MRVFIDLLQVGIELDVKKLSGRMRECLSVCVCVGLVTHGQSKQTCR